jgi:hypothetical protein
MQAEVSFTRKINGYNCILVLANGNAAELKQVSSQREMVYCRLILANGNAS